MVRYAEGAWKPPIVVGVGRHRATASTSWWRRLDAHWAWLGESGERERRRLARAREEISAIAVAEMRRQIGGLPGQSRLDDLAAQVAAGKLDPYSAADELIAG